MSYPYQLPDLRPPPGDQPATLPLWLTQEEAETLILLSCASSQVADGEEALFRKLGELFRAFTR